MIYRKNGLEGIFFLARPLFEAAPLRGDYQHDFGKQDLVRYPESTKKIIDEIISEWLNTECENFDLDWGAGSFTCFVLKKFLGIHEEKHGGDLDVLCGNPNCICNFDNDRIWGLFLFHKLMKIVRKKFGEEKFDEKAFENFLSDASKDQRPTLSSYYQRYVNQNNYFRVWYESQKNKDDYQVNEKYEGATANFEHSVEFIFGTVLGNPEFHFNIGKISDLISNGKIVRKNVGTKDSKTSFTDLIEVCSSDRHKSMSKKPIWKSKSNLMPPKYIEKNNKKIWISPNIKPPLSVIVLRQCFCATTTELSLESGVTIHKKHDKDKVIKLETPDGKWKFDYQDIGDNDYSYFGQPVVLSVNTKEKLAKLKTHFYRNFFPNKQAEIAGKLLATKDVKAWNFSDYPQRKPLTAGERHSKFLLRKNIKKLRMAVDYREDIEHLEESI